MFVLKFFKKPESGVFSHVVSCQHYEKHVREDGITTITIYKSDFTENGIEFHITKEDNGRHYYQCYIENIAGKTIDKVNVYLGV